MDLQRVFVRAQVSTTLASMQVQQLMLTVLAYAELASAAAGGALYTVYVECIQHDLLALSVGSWCFTVMARHSISAVVAFQPPVHYPIQTCIKQHEQQLYVFIRYPLCHISLHCRPQHTALPPIITARFVHHSNPAYQTASSGVPSTQQHIAIP